MRLSSQQCRSPMHGPCRTRRRARRQGFTLLEIMIVVAIFTILTAVGYGFARELVPQYRTRSAAMDFANNASQCRNIAMRSGRECRILLTAFDGALTNLDVNAGAYMVQVEIPGDNGWDTLPIDTIDDIIDDNMVTGTIDLASGQTKLRRVAVANWGAIGGPGIGNTDAIVFDSRGFVRNPVSDFTNGTIDVTFVNKVAEANTAPDRWVAQISRTGIVKLNSSRRLTDDNGGTPGTAIGTAYDAAGPYGAP